MEQNVQVGEFSTRKKYLVLQPFSEQAIFIVRLLKENSNCEVIAILLKGESELTSHLYDRIHKISDYSELTDHEGVIIPTGAPSTETLLKRGDIVLGNITMKKNTIIVYDKIQFLEKCYQNNLPIPLCFNFNELIEDYFPLFYKEKNEKGGGVRGIANKIEDLNGLPIDQLIFQELIDSKGTYGVAFLAVDGEVTIMQAHFEEESYPISGGSATLITSVQDERLYELTKKFVKYFNYSGWGLAEYKYCNKRKDYVFMEVNAKFWASCIFTFLNNNLFFKELFGVNTYYSNVNKIIFLNRLLKTGIINTIKVMSSNRGAKIIYGSRCFYSFLGGIIKDSLLIKNLKFWN